jgi:hypothetical protein
MWTSQVAFRGAVGFAVERVLDELGRPARPDVVLVGFRRQSGSRDPIRIEPDDGRLGPADFERPAVWAAELAGPKPATRRGRRPSLAEGPAVIDDRGRRSALGAILETRLGGRFFVSDAVTVSEHRVFIAAGLPKVAVDDFPALTRDRTDVDRVTLARSLLEAAIDPLLQQAAFALYAPDPGSGPGFRVDADEIARQAGETLVLDAASRAYSGPPAYGLFEALNRLATATYEKRTGLGRLVLASPTTSGLDRLLSLQSPVPMKEIRTVRKLLETTRREGAALLTTGSLIYGLGDIDATYDVASESIFEIVVTGPGSWDLRHGGQPLMAVTDGAPRLAGPRFGRAQFESLAGRLFSDRDDYDIDRLWGLAIAASEAEHGTMLVVSAQAAEEAMRLSSQALVLDPVQLSPPLIRQVTSIDGAVLVDPGGVITAIGAILDGSATTGGDRARGARFNSAVRYLATAPRGTMIVLVSEDGTLDLLP